MEDQSSVSMHKYHFSADLLTKLLLLILSHLPLWFTPLYELAYIHLVFHSLYLPTILLSFQAVQLFPALRYQTVEPSCSVARSFRSTRTDTSMFMWLQLMFIIVIWSQRIYWLMLTVNLKYVTLDWQEWHSVTLLQQYSGRYVDSGRLDSCSTFCNRLYSYSVSQKFQDYVATRWYRAPELCGSFFSKVTNLHILI